MIRISGKEKVSGVSRTHRSGRRPGNHCFRFDNPFLGTPPRSKFSTTLAGKRTMCRDSATPCSAPFRYQRMIVYVLTCQRSASCSLVNICLSVIPAALSLTKVCAAAALLLKARRLGQFSKQPASLGPGSRAGHFSTLGTVLQGPTHLRHPVLTAHSPPRAWCLRGPHQSEPAGLGVAAAPRGE